MEHKFDNLQSQIDQNFDNLQYSISRITNQQHVHKEEVNPEEECLIDTTVEEQCKQQDEEISSLLTEEGSGKEIVEGTQKPIFHPIPIKLNPSATAQATKSPQPAAPSPSSVYILPSPATHSTPETPTGKATPFALPVLQNFRKLVATTQIFATTSNTLAAAHTAWHNGWFGCWFKCGALGPQHIYKLHQFQQPPKA